MTGLQRWYKNGTALLDEIGASETAPGSALIWFMGQHGFVLNVNNIIIYIDVILNALPGGDGKDRRRYPPPFDPD
jgi:hypothetical protein